MTIIRTTMPRCVGRKAGVFLLLTSLEPDPREQHQALKALAALEGKSIKQYALERLFPSASPEEQALHPP